MPLVKRFRILNKALKAGLRETDLPRAADVVCRQYRVPPIRPLGDRMNLQDAIVFQEQEDGSWTLFDHGDELSLFAKYRAGSQPRPLAMVRFKKGWPVSMIRREP